MEEKFELRGDDYLAIAIAKRTARNFLKMSNISPREIVGLGNALYALERLPRTTTGIFSSFGIVYRAGTEDFSEMKYISFNVYYDTLEIAIGGSVYDKAVGSDSYSDPSWRVELGGYRESECDLERLEDLISEYLNLGALITVSDESEIDFDMEDEEEFSQ